MDRMNMSLDELKFIFKIPKLFLANFFLDLRSQVDAYFVKQQQKNGIWIDLINRINIFERDCLKNTIKKVIDRNQFIEKEFQSIELAIKRLNCNNEKIQERIEILGHRIESYLFNNRTIAFMENYAWNENNTNEKFLLVINDEYLSKKSVFSLNDGSFILRDGILKAICLRNQLILSQDVSYYKEINLNMSNVKELSLLANKIDSITPNLFICLLNLEKLCLENNKLTNLNANLFNGLVNLKELILDTNLINFVEENTFQPLINLVKLSLCDNKLSKIKVKTFNGLSSLKMLNLYSNKINTIEDDSFKCLIRLETLDISYNRLSKIKQTELNGLSGLENFDLTSNQIEHIECRFLLNCRKLILNNNKLKSVQNVWLHAMTRLEVLDLKDNHITVLNGKAFANLANLKELNFVNNPLKLIDRKVFRDFKRKNILKLFNENNFSEKIKRNIEINF
jgi:hypothetical protein